MKILMGVLILSLALPLQRARAGDQSIEDLYGPLPETSERDRICKTSAPSEQMEMRATHCEAADLELQTSKAQKYSTWTWGVVATGCAALCTAGFFTAAATEVTLAKWCMGGFAAGIVTDMIASGAITDSFVEGPLKAMGDDLSQSFGNPVVQGVGTATSVATLSGSSKGALDLVKRKGSCIMAGVSGYLTYKKNKARGDATERAREQLRLAQGLNSDGTAAGGDQGTSQAAIDGNGTSASNTQLGTRPGGLGRGPQRGDSGALAQSGCNSVNSSQGAISCALASDPSLPRFIGEPGFQNDFKELTGVGVDDFFKAANQDLTGAIASASSGGSSRASNEVARHLNAAKSAAGGSAGVAGTAYASGGGGGTQGGGDGPDMNAIMAGILDQFGPKKAAEKDPTGKTIAFQGLANRSPASLAEDTTVSIFDRVSFRYSRSSTSVGGSEWSLPANRVMHGLPHVMR